MSKVLVFWQKEEESFGKFPQHWTGECLYLYICIFPLIAQPVPCVWTTCAWNIFTRHSQYAFDVYCAHKYHCIIIDILCNNQNDHFQYSVTAFYKMTSYVPKIKYLRLGIYSNENHKLSVYNYWTLCFWYEG